jgi:hypothetical protein
MKPSVARFWAAARMAVLAAEFNDKVLVPPMTVGGLGQRPSIMVRRGRHLGNWRAELRTYGTRPGLDSESAEVL